MNRRETSLYSVLAGHLAPVRMFTLAGVRALAAAIHAEAARHEPGELFVFLPGEGDFGTQFLRAVEVSSARRPTIVVVTGNALYPPRPGLEVIQRRGGCLDAGAWAMVWSSPAGGAAFAVERASGSTERLAPYRGHVTYEPRRVVEAREAARRLVQACGGRDTGPLPFQAPTATLAGHIAAGVAWELEMAAARAEQRAHELEASRVEFANANAEMVERLVNVMLHRDPETGDHLRRIGWYAQELAEHLGQDIAFCLDISFAAMLHDIGKVVIPDLVLLEPGALDDDGWDVMRQHPELGARLLSGSASPLLNMAERIALSHHERWDGQGYPHGIRADAIPLEAQITSVVDAFDAMMSRRRYREPMPVDQALEELRSHAGTQFGPDVVRTFLRHAPPPVSAP